MANDAKFTPGMTVWVITRNPYDDSDAEVVGFVFIAQAPGVVIVSPHVNDYDLERTLLYHMETTQEEGETSLLMFPDEDCFVNRENAQAALED